MSSPQKPGVPPRPRTEEMFNALQQKVQSLELMKIVLHITLAGIFFKRDLLPLVTFGERSLSIPKAPNREGSHIRTYEEFISAENNQVDGPTFQVKVMERGVDSRTDRVLDLLEGSIFEVLVRRRLQAVKFTIVKKVEPPIEIVEAYTISFKYHSEHSEHSKPNSQDQDASKTNPGLNTGKEEKSKTSSLITIRSAMDIAKGIQQMDRLLIPITATFTKLPNARALGVFLLYTDDCPKGYQAPDFVDAGGFAFKFANEEDQAVRKLSCGGISTGHHFAHLKVTYLNPVSTLCRSSEAQMSPRPARVTQEEADAIPIPLFKVHVERDE